MRAIKSFFVFALFLCLTEQCLVAQQLGNDDCNGRVRFAAIFISLFSYRCRNVLDVPNIFSSQLKLSSLSSAVSLRPLNEGHNYSGDFIEGKLVVSYSE